MVSALTLGGPFLLLVDQAVPLNPLHLLRFGCACRFALLFRSLSSAMTDRRGPAPGGTDMFRLCEGRGLEGLTLEAFALLDAEESMAWTRLYHTPSARRYRGWRKRGSRLRINAMVGMYKVVSCFRASHVMYFLVMVLPFALLDCPWEIKSDMLVSCREILALIWRGKLSDAPSAPQRHRCKIEPQISFWPSLALFPRLSIAPDGNRRRESAKSPSFSDSIHTAP